MIGKIVLTDGGTKGTIIDKYKSYNDVFGDGNHVVVIDAYLIETEEGKTYEVFPEDIKEIIKQTI